MPHDTAPITAASKYPGCVERLRKAGRPNIARMAEIMGKPSDIDHALGATSAASHWLSGRNNASGAMEAAAGMWLELHRAEEHEPETDAAAPDCAVLAVYCPPHMTGKALRLLALMGCEAVEI